MTLCGLWVALLTAAPVGAQEVRPYRVEGQAIEQPLAASGDPARGRALLVARDPANCILCHAAPVDLVKSGVRF
jgi:sulfur-oxidizing protein SoxX